MLSVYRDDILRRMANAEQERLRCVAFSTVVAKLGGDHGDIAALAPFADFWQAAGSVLLLYCPTYNLGEVTPIPDVATSLPGLSDTVYIGRFGRLLNTSSASAISDSVHNALTQFAAMSFHRCGGLAIGDPRVQHGSTAQLIVSVRMPAKCHDWAWPSITDKSPLQAASVVHRVLGDICPSKIGFVRTGTADVQPTQVIRVALGMHNNWILLLRRHLLKKQAALDAAVFIAAQVHNGFAEVELFDSIPADGVERIFSEKFVHYFLQLCK